MKLKLNSNSVLESLAQVALALVLAVGLAQVPARAALQEPVGPWLGDSTRHLRGGIEGRLFLAGACPAGGPGFPCPPPTPSQGKITVFSASGRLIGRFTTDAQGRFRIGLHQAIYKLAFAPMPTSTPNPSNPHPGLVFQPTSATSAKTTKLRSSSSVSPVVVDGQMTFVPFGGEVTVRVFSHRFTRIRIALYNPSIV